MSSVIRGELLRLAEICEQIDVGEELGEREFAELRGEEFAEERMWHPSLRI